MREKTCIIFALTLLTIIFAGSLTLIVFIHSNDLNNRKNETSLYDSDDEPGNVDSLLSITNYPNRRLFQELKELETTSSNDQLVLNGTWKETGNEELHYYSSSLHHDPKLASHPPKRERQSKLLLILEKLKAEPLEGYHLAKNTHTIKEIQQLITDEIKRKNATLRNQNQATAKVKLKRSHDLADQITYHETGDQTMDGAVDLLQIIDKKNSGKTKGKFLGELYLDPTKTIIPKMEMLGNRRRRSLNAIGEKAKNDVSKAIGSDQVLSKLAVRRELENKRFPEAQQTDSSHRFPLTGISEGLNGSITNGTEGLQVVIKNKQMQKKPTVQFLLTNRSHTAANETDTKQRRNITDNFQQKEVRGTGVYHHINSSSDHHLPWFHSLITRYKEAHNRVNPQSYDSQLASLSRLDDELTHLGNDTKQQQQNLRILKVTTDVRMEKTKNLVDNQPNSNNETESENFVAGMDANKEGKENVSDFIKTFGKTSHGIDGKHNLLDMIQMHHVYFHTPSIPHLHHHNDYPTGKVFKEAVHHDILVNDNPEVVFPSFGNLRTAASGLGAKKVHQGEPHEDLIFHYNDHLLNKVTNIKHNTIKASDSKLYPSTTQEYHDGAHKFDPILYGLLGYWPYDHIDGDAKEFYYAQWFRRHPNQKPSETIHHVDIHDIKHLLTDDVHLLKKRETTLVNTHKLRKLIGRTLKSNSVSSVMSNSKKDFIETEANQSRNPVITRRIVQRSKVPEGYARDFAQGSSDTTDDLERGFSPADTDLMKQLFTDTAMVNLSNDSNTDLQILQSLELQSETVDDPMNDEWIKSKLRQIDDVPIETYRHDKDLHLENEDVASNELHFDEVPDDTDNVILYHKEGKKDGVEQFNKDSSSNLVENFVHTTFTENKRSKPGDVTLSAPNIHVNDFTNRVALVPDEQNSLRKGESTGLNKFYNSSKAKRKKGNEITVVHSIRSHNVPISSRETYDVNSREVSDTDYIEDEDKILDLIIQKLNSSLESNVANYVAHEEVTTARVSSDILIIAVCVTFIVTCMCALGIGIAITYCSRKRFSPDIWWSKGKKDRGGWVGSVSDESLLAERSTDLGALYHLKGDELKRQVSKMVHESVSSSHISEISSFN